MRTTVIIALAGLALAGCYRNQTVRANASLRYSDTPSHITCYGYGGLMVDAQSRGAVERDDDGLITFIDAKTGHVVKTEGECVIDHGAQR